MPIKQYRESGNFSLQVFCEQNFRVEYVLRNQIVLKILLTMHGENIFMIHFCKWVSFPFFSLSAQTWAFLRAFPTSKTHNPC